MSSRRQFITLLGGAAAVWPLAARGEQLGGRRRLGVLMATAIDDPESRKRLFALLQGLQQLGWVEDRLLDTANTIRLLSRNAAFVTSMTQTRLSPLRAR